jgi:hypothetical protein
MASGKNLNRVANRILAIVECRSAQDEVRDGMAEQLRR